MKKRILLLAFITALIGVFTFGCMGKPKYDTYVDDSGASPTPSAPYNPPTVTPSGTPTPSVAPSVTPMVTPSPSTSPSVTPTYTPTPTPTSTPTPTPTPTQTPFPSALYSDEFASISSSYAQYTQDASQSFSAGADGALSVLKINGVDSDAWPKQSLIKNDRVFSGNYAVEAKIKNVSGKGYVLVVLNRSASQVNNHHEVEGGGVCLGVQSSGALALYVNGSLIFEAQDKVVSGFDGTANYFTVKVAVYNNVYGFWVNGNFMGLYDASINVSQGTSGYVGLAANRISANVDYFKVTETTAEEQTIINNNKSSAVNVFSVKDDFTSVGSNYAQYKDTANQSFTATTDGGLSTLKIQGDETDWYKQSLVKNDKEYAGNYAVEAKIKNISGQGFTLLFLNRNTGNANANHETAGGGFCVGVQSSGKLAMYVNGSLIYEAENKVVTNFDGTASYYTIRIAVYDNYYGVWVNGTYMCLYNGNNNGNQGTSGYVGLSANKASSYVDYLTVSSVSASDVTTINNNKSNCLN